MLGHGGSGAQGSVVPVLAEHVGERDREPWNHLGGNGGRPVQGAGRGAVKRAPGKPPQEDNYALTTETNGQVSHLLLNQG